MVKPVPNCLCRSRLNALPARPHHALNKGRVHVSEFFGECTTVYTYKLNISRIINMCMSLRNTIFDSPAHPSTRPYKVRSGTDRSIRLTTLPTQNITYQTIVTYGFQVVSHTSF